MLNRDNFWHFAIPLAAFCAALVLGDPMGAMQ